MYLDIDNFNLHGKEVLGFLDENMEDPKKFRDHYANRIQKIEVENIISAINNFVISELDLQTSSKRGVGRSTNYYPRFGGYFYTSLKKKNEEEIKEIGILISKIISKSYQTLLVLVDEYTPNDLEVNELYKKWVLSIYLNNFNTDIVRLPENIREIIFGVIGDDYQKITALMDKKSIKPGFLVKDKRKDILISYINAGLILNTITINN